MKYNLLKFCVAYVIDRKVAVTQSIVDVASKEQLL